MGGFCFVSGTLVTMGDGAQEVIQDIEVGDSVLSWNSSSNSVESGVVSAIQNPYHYQLVKLGFAHSQNVNTYDHPYYVKDKEWASYSPSGTLSNYGMTVEQLEKNDVCYYFNGSELIESNLTGMREDKRHKSWEFQDQHHAGQVGKRTWNLILSGSSPHYFANGMLVHNKFDESIGSETYTISASGEQVPHTSMSVGDKVMAASIEGLPDTDIYAEFLLWEYTGSIADAITLVTASIVDISEVTHSNYHVIDCQTAGGEPIKITWNHPVLAKSGSVWAFEYTGDIDTSYKLLSSSLEEVSINSITPTTSSLITRRFDVEPQDTYFAGEILVHN